MTNSNLNDSVNTGAVNTAGKGIIARLYGQAVWMLVPLTLYVFALVPIDTFVPTKRSTRRPTAVPVSKQDAEAIRNETEQLLESLMARKHIHPQYEGKLKVRSAPEEITAIENYVGTRLPEDIRYFIERFDGLETGTSYRSVNWLSRRTMLHDSHETASIHSDYVLVPQMLPGAWYHPAIVVFDDADGGGLGVDAFSGIIYEWDHDGGQLQQVAPSFRALLRGLDQQMESGKEPYWSDLEIP